MFHPVLYTHIASAIALLIGIILSLYYSRQILQLPPTQLALFFLLLSIALAHHGQSHALLEKRYPSYWFM